MDPDAGRLPAGRPDLAPGGTPSTTPVPAIFEYVPYRKNDGLVLRDAPIHHYFAGHGYASVRVDIRGTGDSDGILADEYLPLEQQDGVEVIRWLATRPWCTGKVGIIGKSWGGFNGLQIAAHHPPELAAVISVASTDDRYADDVHYMGGCLLAWTALPWASTMLAYNGLPPDPAVVGERVARDLAGAAGEDPAVHRGVAGPPAPRRVLAPGLGVRGLRGDSLPGLHGRRLGRRLPQRDPPVPRGLLRGRARA